VAYCNSLSVKMASENSSEDEFETLLGTERPYLFEQTAKPGAEWINLTYLPVCRSITQKLVDNINFQSFLFVHRPCNDKLSISYLLVSKIYYTALIVDYFHWIWA